MNFWEAKRKAKANTVRYISLFAVLILIVAALIEYVLSNVIEGYGDAGPFFGPLFIIVTVLVAFFQYMQFGAQGGAYVAESMGGKRIERSTTDFAELQLLNIVEEIALSASVPMPAVYILPVDEINAFAAGLTPDDAAIAISYGALTKLNRQEVQGVIAHEFGHIANGDMKISMRLAAMVMGFFFIVYMGIRVLQFSQYRSSDTGRQSPMMLIALAFMVAGAVTWFFGSILKASVSRQREYLADASSVQYTRNPEGIAGALQKIEYYSKQDPSDMPIEGLAFSHLYFQDRTFLSDIFSTHPPVQKRISAILGREYIPSEWNIPK